MEINTATKQYWSEENLQAVKEAKDFKDLYIVAEKILRIMPQPISQVCGPIGTGGLGNIEDNLNAFNEAIKELQSKGIVVFDQMPFEWPIQGLKFNLPKDAYPESILSDFYLPIFESGYVSKLYFMKNWQSSKGANWEHDQAKRLGIEIAYL